MVNRSVRYVLVLTFLVGAGQAHSQQTRGPQNNVQRAIERAISYLQAEDTKKDLQTLFLYQFVQRKFDLAAIADYNLADSVLPGHTFYPFLRLIPGLEPTVDSSIFRNAGSDIDRITLMAIYCDQHPLPDHFLDSLLVASRKGKYALTHSLWAMQLLTENECLGSLKGHRQVSDSIAKNIARMVGDASFKDDISIEGMCFLFGMKRADLIDPAWINVMIGHQSSDGGFYRTPKNALTNAKTTVLALWCMLEHQSEASITEPWIR